MSRLVIVANRLPIRVVKSPDGVNYDTSAGGVATGLYSLSKSHSLAWVGWPEIKADDLNKREQTGVTEKLAQDNLYPVYLSAQQARDYYDGFCNKTIWPLFHYFSLYTVYEDKYWQAYKKVNELFCNAVLEHVKAGDQIWIHDYQLMLLPKLIRERLPEAQIGFFLHIPFPSFELFRVLPWRMEILNGILGADLVGFHTYDYVRHFLSCACRIAGAEHAMGCLTLGNRVVRTDAFPMGIDYNRYATAVNDPQVKENAASIREKALNRKIIISIDRLDYTKGITQRLEAFDLFLSQNPEYREKVTLIMLAVPSRTAVSDYMQLRRQLEVLVGRINGEHGSIGWVPVWYLYRAVPFEELVALYSIADVALVTPLRDGMNLIAKEFIATKTNGRGVLILSEMAGAASELGEAVVINANDKEAIVEAIKKALEMPEAEQIERNRLMQARLARYTIARWTNDFLQTLSEVKKTQQEMAVRKLTAQGTENLIDAYNQSPSCLLLLDYDGTLVKFAGRPEKAGPDNDLLVLLEILAKDVKNELVIISGRDKQTLDQWLGGLGICLIAEHGGWVKTKDGQWEAMEIVPWDWKELIRPILELYTDRTPGSFIEEKDFSLVWHYRKADPCLANLRTQELRDAVLNLTANRDIGVFEGSKILEVRKISINKGRAAERWLAKKNWDFILAAGDDYTDEDLFSILPKTAYSIKVGYSISKARFNVDSVDELRALLKKLAKKTDVS